MVKESSKDSRDSSPSVATPPSEPMPDLIEEEKSSKPSLQASLENAANIKKLMKEKEELEKQVKDWQERTETIVNKRRQDREALKEAERARIQLQTLEEFKARIMDQHNDLKKELREERKRREDLAEEFDAFREDMGEASETIEMMTLDKEMAEEQSNF